jgi:hypothetical protein
MSRAVNPRDASLVAADVIEDGFDNVRRYAKVGGGRSLRCAYNREF